MDIKLKQNTTQSFQARKIAQAIVKNTNQKIELYSLEASDKAFAQKFYQNLNLISLYPKLPSYDGFEAWDNIIHNGIKKIGTNDVILAIHNKKPCGIMSFYEKDKQVNLTDLAKWRQEPNKDIFHVGKVLMHHLFDITHKNDHWNISLYPTTSTPRGKSCRDFYSQLGFRRSANNSMNLSGANYSQKAKDLEKYFEYEQIKNSPSINLEKELSQD